MKTHDTITVLDTVMTFAMASPEGWIYEALIGKVTSPVLRGYENYLKDRTARQGKERGFIQLWQSLPINLKEAVISHIMTENLYKKVEGVLRLALNAIGLDPRGCFDEIVAWVYDDVVKDGLLEDEQAIIESFGKYIQIR